MSASSPFRPDLLANKVCLVTGGGSGIGFEIARQFVAHGAQVVIMGRRENVLQEALGLLEKAGSAAGVAYYAKGDVRNPDDCLAAVDVAVSRFGRLDVLVNSAAGNFLSSLEDLTPKGFKTVMEIDTMGVFNMASAAFTPLKDSGSGNIINLTATLHYGATWWQGHPSAAKAAIDSLTRRYTVVSIFSNSRAPPSVPTCLCALQHGTGVGRVQHPRERHRAGPDCRHAGLHQAQRRRQRQRGGQDDAVRPPAARILSLRAARQC